MNILDTTNDSLKKQPEPIPEQKEIQDNSDINKDAVVEISGPLSESFTTALNLVFSKESIALLSAIDMSLDMAINNQEAHDPDPDKIYVYCADPDDLEEDGLIKASDELRIAMDSKKYDRVILAIETIDKNKRVTLLESFATNAGATVCNSKPALIRTIKTVLK